MRRRIKCMVESYSEEIICNNCKKIISKYGNDWLTLESYKGQFRDNPEELEIFDFCNDKCLSKYLKENKICGV